MSLPEATNVTMLHATHVTVLDAAFSELCDLYNHDKIRRGDIKQVAIKHGLTPLQTGALRVRLYRFYHGKDVTQRAGACKRKLPSDIKPQNFDAHGRLFYQTLVLNDEYLDKLPVKNSFWRGIKHADFNLQSFKTGKVLVYPLTPSWRSSLEAELSRAGWDPRAVSSFLECLQVNGSKFELAVAIPGVPSGQHYSDKSGLVDIDTDHTPKASGNVEIKVNIGQFEQRLKEIHDDVADLRRDFMKYAGGVTALQVMQNMEFRIDEFAKRIDQLSPGAYHQPPVPASPVPPPEYHETVPQWRAPETSSETRLAQPEKSPRQCPHLKHWDGGVWGCGIDFAVTGPATPEHALLYGQCCMAGFTGCPQFKVMEDIAR